MWPVMNRWDAGLEPFQELNRLQRQVNRLFDGTLGGTASFPALNVWGNGEEVRVAAELPGVDPNKIELTVTGNTLTIEGERPETKLGEKEEWYRQERPVGRFARTVRLPFEVDNDQIAARYEQGILKVTLPRHEATKPRRINVES